MNSVTEKPIPVITLWNPWAMWVMLGWKTIETRLHARFASLEGKWVGIHAAQKWDENWRELAQDYLTPEQIEDTPHFILGNGYLLGVAHVLRCRWLPASQKFSEKALIDCIYTDRFGIWFDRVERWDPILVQGKQGIWYYKRAA